MNKMTSIPILSKEEVVRSLMASSQGREYQSNYFAMYSSWLGGITKDPGLMMVPVDDHIVHRGDGVFEAMKYTHRRVYLLDAHLERLAQSAQALGLKIPVSDAGLREIIAQTVKAAQVDQVLIRLYLSRGPGGFSPNPYESIGAQLYVVATKLRAAPEKWRSEGVTVGRSQIPTKDPLLARVKSCNYLHNVLMKKESVDRGLDFTVGFDPQGNLTEGSTENIILLTRQGVLAHSGLDNILKGTTMTRLFDLVERDKLLPTARGIKLTEQDVLDAQELMMVGTTLDVIPVRSYESKTYSVGPWAKKLYALMAKDQS